MAGTTPAAWSRPLPSRAVTRTHHALSLQPHPAAPFPGGDASQRI